MHLDLISSPNTSDLTNPFKSSTPTHHRRPPMASGQQQQLPNSLSISCLLLFLTLTQIEVQDASCRSITSQFSIVDEVHHQPPGAAPHHGALTADHTKRNTQQLKNSILPSRFHGVATTRLSDSHKALPSHPPDGHTLTNSLRRSPTSPRCDLATYG